MLNKPQYLSNSKQCDVSFLFYSILLNIEIGEKQHNKKGLNILILK